MTLPLSLSPTPLLLLLLLLLLSQPVALSSASALNAHCNQLLDCGSCVAATHLNCGWCHGGFSLEGGTMCVKCASSDQMAHGWHCGTPTDIGVCSQQHKCNYSTGQCELAAAGEGLYHNKSQCDSDCIITRLTYKCNCQNGLVSLSCWIHCCMYARAPLYYCTGYFLFGYSWSIFFSYIVLPLPVRHPVQSRDRPGVLR